jgi:SAM-dependent methyltransferase
MNGENAMDAATCDRRACCDGSQTCPICGENALRPAEQEVEVAAILKRWEHEGSLKFQDDVWRDYAPRPDRLKQHRCANCDFRVFLPIVVGTAAFYRDITAAEYYVRDKWEFLRAERELRRRSPARVIDIGCGHGFFLDRVRAALPHAEAIGFEFDPRLAQPGIARGHTVWSGDLLTAFRERSGGQRFGAVTLFQVLEHVENPAGILESVKHLLEPDGIFIVCVPDAAGPVRHFTNAITDLPPHHVSRWTAKTFQRGMPHLGYRVVEVAHEPLPDFLWDFYLPVILANDFRPAALGRWLNKKGWTAAAIRVLRRLGVRWLRGVRGHTVYAALQPMSIAVESREAPACAA